MIYRFGLFALDTGLRVLHQDGQQICLPGKCLETLIFLIDRRGQVVSKDELLAALWPDTCVEEANLTQNVSTLRKALGDNPKEHRFIATISGRGYSFVAPVTSAPEASIPSAKADLGVPFPSRWQQSLRIGALTLVVIAAVAVWLLLRNGGSHNREGEIKNLPLTSLPGSEYMPRFSPDGRQVAFVWSGDDGIEPQIWVKLIDAGTQLRLTKLPGAVSFPAWSPDGQFLAYAREIAGATEYYIVSAIGGAERQVLRLERTGTGGLDWLPDSRRLIISQISEGMRPSFLLSISIYGGDQHTVTTPPAGSTGDSLPTISPDGKVLAFVRMTSGDVADIYLLFLDTGRLRKLTSDGTRFGGLAWMPDSRELIFSSARNGTYGLWRLSLSGGEPRHVVVGAERAFWPTVARSGQRLAYMTSGDHDSLWQSDLAALKSSGAGVPRRVVTSSRTQSAPQYSPDGKKISYSSSRSGSDEIWVSDANGGTAVQLTSLGRPHTGSPHWSPDGTQIAFDSRPNGNPDVFVVRADGGVPRRLTTYIGDDVTPSWSSDGRSIYFASNRSGEYEVWQVHVSGETASTSAVRVTHSGGFAPMESRDGKYLYFTKSLARSGLWRLALSNDQNGREQPVLSSVGYWGWWALGDDKIFFFEAQPLGSSGIHLDVRPAPADKVLLKYLDMRTGNHIDLGPLDRPVSTCTRVMAISPNGRALVYEQLDQQDSDIMMVENFGSARN